MKTLTASQAGVPHSSSLTKYTNQIEKHFIPSTPHSIGPPFPFISISSSPVIHSQNVDIDKHADNLSECLVGSGPSLKADHLLDAIPERPYTPFDRSIHDSFRNQSAVDVFRNVISLGLPLDSLTVCSAVRACACLSEPAFRKLIHCRCVKSGLLSDVSVSTSLIDVYVKDGELGDGEKVLDDMVVMNVVSWTSLIAGYVRNDLGILLGKKKGEPRPD